MGDAEGDGASSEADEGSVDLATSRRHAPKHTA